MQEQSVSIPPPTHYSVAKWCYGRTCHSLSFGGGRPAGRSLVAIGWNAIYRAQAKAESSYSLQKLYFGRNTETEG